ncbi:asparagine synthetase B (glutamine-hydrolyzing) [Bradyrhizobium japonicum]
MCGIAGILNIRGNPVDPAEISRLTNLLAHRGPFGEGTWFSANRNLAFGHRRLAIIDPGEGGFQPMVSADGRHVIVFNGEIYNFLELRRELEAQGAGLSQPVRHRSHSRRVAGVAGGDVVAL